MSGCCSGGGPSPSETAVQAIPLENIDFKGKFVSEFIVPKMDCPSEEGIIRMALDSLQPSVHLQFDIPNRLVNIFHSDNLDEITQRMEALGFGAQLNTTKEVTKEEISQVLDLSIEKNKSEAITIKWLFAINAIMFVFELIVGWYAQSAGLIADALDMFADAAVYALALFAVGQSAQLKLRAAHVSGWLQLALATGVLIEVIRRFIHGSEPISLLMMGMGAIALIANVICLKLIYKNKDNGAHMKATWIFSANDVIANLGVIIAGIFVLMTGSAIPDLIIGLIIGLIVLNGAFRILRLKS
jgi:Cation efflux family